ncbi:MAG TPA: hypothetical protein VGJ77_01930 [Gaiellaceae bacterium]
MTGADAPLADESLAASPDRGPTPGMKRAILLVTTCYLLTGCGGEVKPQRVPDLRNERLDKAQDRLDDVGLRYETEGGLVVIRRHWVVCDQWPPAGRRAKLVHLYVCHDEADDWDDD